MKAGRALELFKRPRFVLLFGLLGIFIGLFVPTLAIALTPVQSLFLALLKMCAFPIVLTAIVLSCAKLLRSGNTRSFFVSTGKTFLATGLVACFCGMFFGVFLGKVALHTPSVLQSLSGMLSHAVPERNVRSERSIGEDDIESTVAHLIPTNIFKSLSDGEMLSALFFSILLGLAIGTNRSSKKNVLVPVLEELSDAFSRMMDWMTYLLPIGLMSIFAKSFSELGGSGLSFLAHVFGVLLAGFVGILGLQLIAIRVWTGLGIKEILRALKEPLLVAFSTSSSLAALPSLLRNIEENLGIPSTESSLVLPLALSFNPQGSLFLVSFIATFTATLYQLPLGMGGYLLMLVVCFIDPLISAGLPLIATFGMLTALFRSIGLPMEAAAAVFIAVAPFIDPFITLCNVMGVTSSLLIIDSMGRQQTRAPLRAFEAPTEVSAAYVASPPPETER